MMNRVYDFDKIEEIRAEEKKLILYYVLFVLCFAVAVALNYIIVKNNILLTVIFAFVLLAFALFSVAFWKIKYGILRDYRRFLEDLETGKSDDYVCNFEAKIQSSDDEEQLEEYVFVLSNNKKSFWVHKQHRVDFVEGKKYHIECVGRYICQWEAIS